MKALDRYPYCGHCGLLGKIKREMSMTEIANRLRLTQPAVSIAARRGEEMAKQKSYSLFDK
jgi:hypothetical protein